MTSADDVAHALARIDPVRRATLALVARRRLSDERVGALLGVEVGAVAARRDDAVGALAAELGTSHERAWQRLAALPADAWPDAAGNVPQPAVVEPEPAVEPEPEPEAAPAPAPVPHPAPEAAPEPVRAVAPAPPRDHAPAVARREQEQRRRRGGLLAAGAVVLLVVVLLVVLLAGGGSDRSPEAATPPATTTTPAATGSSVALSADGGTLDVRLRGLPAHDGGYALWLYSSIIDARRLATVQAPGGALRVRVPADADDFELLDLSAQRPGEDQHSGASVLRVPIARLERGRTVALAAPAL